MRKGSSLALELQLSSGNHIPVAQIPSCVCFQALHTWQLTRLTDKLSTQLVSTFQPRTDTSEMQDIEFTFVQNQQEHNSRITSTVHVSLIHENV